MAVALERRYRRFLLPGGRGIAAAGRPSPPAWSFIGTAGADSAAWLDSLVSSERASDFHPWTLRGREGILPSRQT